MYPCVHDPNTLFVLSGFARYISANLAQDKPPTPPPGKCPPSAHATPPHATTQHTASIKLIRKPPSPAQPCTITRLRPVTGGFRTVGRAPKIQKFLATKNFT